MKSQYFTSFDGTKICYEYTKKGDKCLIFAHGLGGDLTAWNPERAYFEKLGYSTVALDLRGHALSGKSPDASFYKLDYFAEDIYSLISFLELEKPVLIGHCFGGMVALLFAAKHQHILKSLILIDTTYKTPPYLGKNKVEYALLDHLFGFFAEVLPNVKVTGHVDFTKYIGTHDVDLKRFTSDVLHTSLKSYLYMCQKLTGYDATSVLHKLTIPTLIIEGENDTIIPPEIAIYMSERIKRSELEFVPEGNHILVINNPKEVNAIVQRYLDALKYN